MLAIVELNEELSALIEQLKKLPESEQKYISGYIQGLVDAAEATNRESA